MIDKAVVQCFISVAQSCPQWRNDPGNLSTEEELVIKKTLADAGFKSSKLRAGVLKGRYSDMDPREGETYDVNTLSPFTVIGPDSEPDWRATGWLDHMFKFVGIESKECADMPTLVNMIIAQIENSKPLEPISLTEDGDMLEEPSPTLPTHELWYLVRHTRDKHELNMSAGAHMFCGGSFTRRRATERHDSLSCSACHLRVVFPREVSTYGELRAALKQKP